MSRALEKDIAASLSTTDATAAYEAISQALDLRKADGLLEIEILGQSHALPQGTYVLKDEAALGVSKLGLVQAFLVARQILKTELAAPRQASYKLWAATAVILLMDPEYLTAANTRKRLILEVVQQPPRGYETGVYLWSEKLFLDSLLTSRLHRHTKSPTLWSHRRWFVGLCRAMRQPVDVLGNVVGVVAVAGERHPRNYYAWSHARWLMSLNVPVPQDKLLVAVKDWCLRHRDDISGWSFLSFLLSKHVSPGSTDALDVFREVLGLTERLRWTNESVWVFLRTLAASGVVRDREYIAFQKAGNDLIQASQDAAERARLEASISWCESYRAKAKVDDAGA